MEFTRENFDKLLHHRDTTVGLWATDKDPKELLKRVFEEDPDIVSGSSAKDSLEELFQEKVEALFFKIK